VRVEILRTPEARFRDLPGFAFEPHHAEVPNPDGGTLRMHYLDEGDPAAPTVLLLHGEPTWSYLYRKMIPVLLDAGLRTIAPDHIGFGRSDKPSQKTFYTFERHIEWIRALVVGLDLRDVTLFCQDWGGPIGLAVFAREPQRFARIVPANTILHTVEPELEGRLAFENHGVGEDRSCVSQPLLDWMLHSQRDPDFRASTSVQFATARTVPDDVLAAYDAPFPDERYKQGMRQFPILIPVTRSDPGAAIDRATWRALRAFDKPLLTLYGDADPGTAGWDAIFQERVPGAAGQPHQTLARAGHFLQEDCGEEVASRLVEFIRRTT
jgi:haloalkane dehalogenase